MQPLNLTANQHFVSQAGQRLNASNPNAAPYNQRISAYTVVDRESFTLSLDSVRGTKISSNLAFRDLFSFDVIRSQALRSNLETMFQEYEGVIETNTVGLIDKLQRGQGDIKKEILELFAAKLMNFLRNPYSVKKVLNILGGLLRFRPTDPKVVANYDAVLAGKKPHQSYLCSQLGISPEEYKAWLAALFLTLIRPAPGEPNIMEGMVKGIFESPSGYPMVCVHRHDGRDGDQRCLLSDRGYCTLLRQEQHLSFAFNLCSNAFITYVFASIDALDLPRVPPAVIELYKTQRKSVRVIPFINDLHALARYNQNVVYQCHQTVYSSSSTVYGVTVRHS